MSLRRSDFPDPKAIKKFIKKVEVLVRRSPEYSDWTAYVKDVLGHYSCELSGEMASQVTVEIHHHPVSMYVITKAVINQYLNSEKQFCSFDIAQAIINLHYEDRIGYIPLSRTLHEKFHNGYLHLPMDLIKGDWKYVTFQYDHDDEDLETMQARMAVNFTNCGWNEGQYYWTDSQAVNE